MIETPEPADMTLTKLEKVLVRLELRSIAEASNDGLDALHYEALAAIQSLVKQVLGEDDALIQPVTASGLSPQEEMLNVHITTRNQLRAEIRQRCKERGLL